jgi:beta-fructofuranosidase
VIPFYWNGEYHVFYLKAPLPPLRHGPWHTPWAHVVSGDLISWRELPLALPLGDPGEPDSVGCWTGCVIEKNGLFHIYYTGFAGVDASWPQTICHATSTDLVTWFKDPTNPILKPDLTRFTREDWRDPFVFWNNRENCYWMVLTTRLATLPVALAGCIVVARSPDLLRWEIGEVLFAAGGMGCPECPDLFSIDHDWYLVFSTDGVTRYVRASAPSGPWRMDRYDTFDDTHWYAAKTISTGRQRFLLGWIRTLEGQQDGGRFEWGGALGLPREVVRLPSGSLATRSFEGIRARHGRKTISREAPELDAVLGQWQPRDGGWINAAQPGHALALVSGEYANGDLEICLEPDADVRWAGIVTGMDRVTCRGLAVEVDVRQRVLRLFQYPSRQREAITQQPIPDDTAAPWRLRVVRDGTLIEAFLNDRVAVSGRCYAAPSSGRIGLFSDCGTTWFGQLSIWEL